MGASDRLNEPYLLGGKESAGDGSALPVIIDGRGYLIDTSRQANQSERFRRTSVQLLNTQQNPEKGESALTTPEVWRRTYQSWHHGMGQVFADREDSDPYRYDWSKGIDPWSRWRIGLLHDTGKVSDTPTASGASANGIVAVLSGDRKTITFTDGTNSATSVLAHDAILLTDGYYIYALQGSSNTLRTFEASSSGSAVTVTEKAATTTHFDQNDLPTFATVANLKMVACTASGKVYDITGYLGATKPTALPSPVYTPPSPAVDFVAGCSGRKSIYLMSVTGDRSVIHSLTISTGTNGGTDDVLRYEGVAAELPDGEIGHSLYSYLGYVAIGTSKGFRFAAAGEGVTYGPLIETPGPVTAFEGQGKYLYYALAGYRGDTGIGRADLSEFVADLQPAYAADLMIAGAAASKVTFIATLRSGKTLIGLDAGGTWIERDTYVPSGEITLSGWTFNVADPKVGLYVATNTSVGTGGEGSLWALYDRTDDEVFLGEYQRAQQRFPLSGRTFHSIALMGRLRANPTNAAITPYLYGLDARATYVRGQASEWQVPCILHDEIEMDNGAVQSRDVVADLNHLIGLCQGGRLFTYVEDDRQWTVVATDYIWSPHERSASSGWQGVFTIYFREVR